MYVFLQAGMKKDIVTMIGGCMLDCAGAQALLCRMETDYWISALMHIMSIFSTGNQCRLYKICEIRSLEQAPNTSLAAVFGILLTQFNSILDNHIKER